MRTCDECGQTFKWNDEIVIADDRLFHKDCVVLYPQGYIAFVNDDPIGEVECEDMAFSLLNKGDYLEESEK